MDKLCSAYRTLRGVLLFTSVILSPHTISRAMGTTTDLKEGLKPALTVESVDKKSDDKKRAPLEIKVAPSITVNVTQPTSKGPTEIRVAPPLCVTNEPKVSLDAEKFADNGKRILEIDSPKPPVSTSPGPSNPGNNDETKFDEGGNEDENSDPAAEGYFIVSLERKSDRSGRGPGPKGKDKLKGPKGRGEKPNKTNPENPKPGTVKEGTPADKPATPKDGDKGEEKEAGKETKPAPGKESAPPVVPPKTDPATGAGPAAKPDPATGAGPAAKPDPAPGAKGGAPSLPASSGNLPVAVEPVTKTSLNRSIASGVKAFKTNADDVAEVALDEIEDEESSSGLGEESDEFEGRRNPKTSGTKTCKFRVMERKKVDNKNVDKPYDMKMNNEDGSLSVVIMAETPNNGTANCEKESKKYDEDGGYNSNFPMEFNEEGAIVSCRVPENMITQRNGKTYLTLTAILKTKDRTKYKVIPPKSATCKVNLRLPVPPMSRGKPQPEFIGPAPQIPKINNQWL